MPTEDCDVDLDVFGDCVDMVFVWSDDLLLFFAPEGGRMARRPRPRALPALTGFLRSSFGICTWSIPPRFGWLLNPRK
jgi:hypothetical protein